MNPASRAGSGPEAPPPPPSGAAEGRGGDARVLRLGTMERRSSGAGPRHPPSQRRLLISPGRRAARLLTEPPGDEGAASSRSGLRKGLAAGGGCRASRYGWCVLRGVASLSLLSQAPFACAELRGRAQWAFGGGVVGCVWGVLVNGCGLEASVC